MGHKRNRTDGEEEEEVQQKVEEQEGEEKKETQEVSEEKKPEEDGKITSDEEDDVSGDSGKPAGPEIKPNTEIEVVVEKITTPAEEEPQTKKAKASEA